MHARSSAVRPALVFAMIRASFVLLLLICDDSAVWAQSLKFPQLTGRVVDEAAILDQAAKAALDRKLADFEAKTTGQFVVVTLKSLQGTSIEDYGYQLGRHWGIGQKGKNSGVMLIVVPSERRVRIEVGYGLEGSLTDAVSRLIIENSILPRFRAKDFAGGISRGVDDIIQALADPQEWRLRAKQRPDNQSGGINIIVLVLIVIVVVLVLGSVGSSGGPPGATGRRGRRSRSYDHGPVFMPMPGSWDSGSGSGDSSGGFSGGGGSFGGGGASGSW